MHVCVVSYDEIWRRSSVTIFWLIASPNVYRCPTIICNLAWSLPELLTTYTGCLKKTTTSLSADRCNATLGYCRNMSSVICRLSVCLWHECIVIKRLQLGSCSFYSNVAQCLTSLPAKFDCKIRRGPSIWGLKLGWKWFSTLRCCISETVWDRA